MNQQCILRELVSNAEGNTDIEVMWLYGSRARGTDLEHSDFDIAIAFKNFGLSTIDKVLRPQLLALDWAELWQVSEDLLSVVDINLVPIYLAYNIVNAGKVIYHTETQREFLEQNRIFSQYEFYLVENREH